MLRHASHSGGVSFKTEIQFQTRFDYMFPRQARTPECLLPPEVATLEALLDLGEAMSESTGGGAGTFDSDIPAGFTYLGQFIDHDITARTDRELFESRIAELDGTPRVAKPVEPDHVVEGLTNGRRPHLDLDSVYGDGPGLFGDVESAAQALYQGDLSLKLAAVGSGVDLPREDRRAIIADMRNDENVIVSQLHARFLAFNNAVFAALPFGSNQARYSRARQITRWAYQAVVLNDYLAQVCDAAVVADILSNGPRFFSPVVDGGPLYMPLEFSVAAFRFGHSMIRPSYRLNDGMTDEEPIKDLLDTKHRITGMQLPEELLVQWKHFVGPSAQPARKIDIKLSDGLDQLPFGPNVFAQLARRNLLRGYLLSIPTGQAVASAMGIKPLSEEQLLQGEDAKVEEAFRKGCFGERTPLWYYILKEADVHKSGQTLGAVGSRIVAEVLIGLIKHDCDSVLAATDALVSRSSDGFAGAEEVGRVTKSTRTGSTDVPASEEKESFISVEVHHPGGTTHVKRLADLLAVAGG